MDTITKQLAEALRDAIGDCHEVINSRVQSLGENYRPHVLAAMRKAVAEKESILAAYDAQPLQQARQPLSEAQVVKCLVDSGCIGTVKMSFDSGPYEITRPSFNANRLVGAVEIAHGITGEQP